MLNSFVFQAIRAQQEEEVRVKDVQVSFKKRIYFSVIKTYFNIKLKLMLDDCDFCFCKFDFINLQHCIMLFGKVACLIFILLIIMEKFG